MSKLHRKVTVRRSLLFIIFIAGTVLWGYFSSYAQEPSTNKAYVKKAAIWRTQQIPVCWENPSSGNATERGWVIDAVDNNTWAANSSLDFVESLNLGSNSMDLGSKSSPFQIDSIKRLSSLIA